jgi:hypothetical protein
MIMNRRDFLKVGAAGAMASSGILASGRVLAQAAREIKIPITMSHGVDRIPREGATGRQSVSYALMNEHYRIAHEMGFQTIGYDDLEKWMNGTGTLPERPLMIDFDHPTITMRYEVNDIMQRYGFRPTLFVNTAGIEAQAAGPLPPYNTREFMTWDEVNELVEAGWHIGSHTVNHPNLSELSVKDPSGATIAKELDQNLATIKSRLGIDAKDFAYTGTSFSSQAEQEVKKRYRFGRLWIVRAMYNMDGKEMRYAEVLGDPNPDEADGGPPKTVRYITKSSNRYRLPSVDTNYLIHDLAPFRRYLEEALT